MFVIRPSCLALSLVYFLSAFSIGRTMPWHANCKGSVPRPKQSTRFPDNSESAECSRDSMFIYVDTAEPFQGIVNGRGFRDSCFALGDGVSKHTVLVIPLLSTPNDAVYCGQSRDLANGDYKVAVDVHAHKVLEVENDKTFIISCNQNGMLGSGIVHLSLVQNGQDITRAVQGDDYTVRISYTNATLDKQQLDVRNCQAFGRGNYTQPLSDSRGCPVDGSGLSKFTTTDSVAEASLHSMVRFQDSSQVHIQCEVGLCRIPCPQVLCKGDAGYNPNEVVAVQKQPRQNGNGQGLAGSTFTVLEPGTSALVPAGSSQCGYGEWVLALCITFGILFLIMLIVNIIMCSAVSCNCTQKEQTEEIHHDAWGEYDTVKNAWSSSASGASGHLPTDRHSLHSIPNNGQSQYAPRGPSPYHHPSTGRAVLYDDGEIRDASRPYVSSGHQHYSDHYAMSHRNGSKY